MRGGDVERDDLHRTIVAYRGPMERIIVPDPDQIALTAAGLIADEIAGHDRLTLGLAGGSTPVATHAELARLDLDWSGVTAWIPDERWVPPDHEDANQRMARETLTDGLGVELLAPDTRLPTPTDAARSYGDLVIPLLTDRTVRTVTMLGLGTDGHTASLFAGTRAASIAGVSYVANFVPDLDAWRVTATFGLLAASHVVVFLVSGSAKAKTVAAVAAGADLPAAKVKARDRVVWIIDESAAALLDD